MYYLSIIIPFHNSVHKCSRLIKTLSEIEDKGIELILVDDGSTDNTLELLINFEEVSNVDVQIISHENKGPGGARNSGTNVSNGIYIWFVDADDDINIKVFSVIKEELDKGFDFIDFNIFSDNLVVNSMYIPKGSYSKENNIKLILIENFGRIWSKIIRRELIIQNNIYYPEYCIYEDNPLVFIYPFFINSFYKSDIVGYYHHEEHNSITRSTPNNKFFDRLLTAEYGLKYALKIGDKNDIDKLKEKFTRLFLINTVITIMTSDFKNSFITSIRIIKLYREKSNEFNISTHLLSITENKLIHKIFFLLIYLFSYLLPSQFSYFGEIRKKAWSKTFDFK